MNESTTTTAATSSVISTAAVRFDGQRFTLGRTDYIIPPLSIGAVKRLFPVIQKLQDSASDTADTVSAAIEVIASAMRRNYPELTDEQVGELIDTQNMADVLETVIAQSGLAKKSRSGASADAGGVEGNGSPEPVSTT